MTFYDQLTQNLKKQVSERFAVLKYENGTHIPTIGDLEPGADFISQDVLTSFGEAALLAPEADDVPLVDVNYSVDKYPVVMAVAGYKISFNEARSSSFANLKVQANRLNVSRRVIAERLNAFAIYGEPRLNIRGLGNFNGVTVDNNSFNPNTADYAAWVTFLVSLVLSLGIDNDATYETTDVLVPPYFYLRAQQITDPQSPSISAMQAVMNRFRNEDGVSSVSFSRSPEVSSVKLERYGVMPAGTNKDRLIVSQKSPDFYHRHIEQTVASMFPEDYKQVRGQNIYYPLYSCASATVISDLNAVRYVDLTKSTLA